MPPLSIKKVARAETKKKKKKEIAASGEMNCYLLSHCHESEIGNYREGTEGPVAFLHCWPAAGLLGATAVVLASS